MTGTLSDTGTDLEARVTAFYSRQMQLLDSGDCTAWAATFTEDGVFAASGLPEAVQGRQAIADGAAGTRARLAGSGLVHRHWLGMVTASRQEDGTVLARCYALVIQTPRGGAPVIHRSTACEDTLVPAGSSWQVAHRKVTRDDLPER